MNPQQQIQALHRTYCDLTRLDLGYNMAVERVWFEWWNEGHTTDDLKLVIAYLRKLYSSKPEVLIACLRLRKLIGDPLHFAEYLAEARAVARRKAMPAEKSKVLESSGRSSELPQTEPVPVRSVLESEAFKRFCDLKHTL